jgi:glutamine cyclotransferase
MKTEKRANIYHSDMENDRVQTYRMIASTMFNDDVTNMGRVLVLLAFTSQMGQQYSTDAWKIWDIYHAVLKGTEYEYFNRSLIHQSE